MPEELVLCEHCGGVLNVSAELGAIWCELGGYLDGEPFGISDLKQMANKLEMIAQEIQQQAKESEHERRTGCKTTSAVKRPHHIIRSSLYYKYDFVGRLLCGPYGPSGLRQ
jgi:hypothetical protein